MTENATPTPAHFLDRTTGQKGAFALDALRGFAILTMAWLPARLVHDATAGASREFLYQAENILANLI